MDEHTSHSNEPVSPDAHAEAAPNPSSEGHSRRVFLFKLSVLLNGAVGAVLAVPIVGYLLGPSMKKRAQENAWIRIGAINDFPEGETRLVNFRDPFTTAWDGQTGDIPCWVRRIAGDDFQVFAINCAHLGCPVRWFAQARLFMCPCHGGAYYQDGSRASGPPERGLFEYAHKIEGGNLVISAGKMPTLAAKNCTGPKLTQIQPATAAAAQQPDEPGQHPAENNQWPA